MAESIERYFHFLQSSRGSRPSGKLWYPAADVYDTSDGWIVKVELAGVSAEDLEIEIRLFFSNSIEDRFQVHIFFKILRSFNLCSIQNANRIITIKIKLQD